MCQDACANDAGTTLSGKVYDPAGKNPLYRAIVSMPRDVHTRVPPIVPGSPACVCDGNVDSAYMSTTTDPTGSFTLSNILVGQNVPVVIQVGKWRRVVSVPQTHACVDNILPVQLSHLPRNQGEGDIPQMAIVTGRCDQLPCLLTSIGLDANEFTGPDGAGRVHVYRGAGPGPDLEGRPAARFESTRRGPKAAISPAGWVPCGRSTATAVSRLTRRRSRPASRA
jgi:hypothetical protein